MCLVKNPHHPDCAMTAEIVNISCDDGGTSFDPTDDELYYEVEVNAVNGSAGYRYSASPISVTGYDEENPILGPYSIYYEPSFTFTDLANSDCSTSIELISTGSCSQDWSGCVINEISITPSPCNNNGTPDDPSDDFFTMEVVVTGEHVSDTWLTHNVGSFSGQYNVPTTIGPFSTSQYFSQLAVKDIASGQQGVACIRYASFDWPEQCENTNPNICPNNLLSNGGFEGTLNDWDITEDITISNQAQDGTQAILACTDIVNGLTGSFVEQTIPVINASQTYQLSWNIWITNGGGLVNIRVRYLDAAGNDFFGEGFNPGGYGIDHWIASQGSFTPPENAAFIEVRLGVSHGSCALFDNICLTTETACVDYLEVDTNEILGGEYRAGLEVQSSGTVINGGNVLFSAANAVLLEAGFEVPLGATFEAVIGGCLE